MQGYVNANDEAIVAVVVIETLKSTLRKQNRYWG